MSAEFAVISLSLFASFFWGAGDFTGGLTSKRMDAFGLVLIAHLGGVPVLATLAIFTGENLPPLDDLLWSAGAGICGAIALTTLYRALSEGYMGIVAPVTAVGATALPVIFAIFTDGLPSNLQITGFMIALVGVWLISQPNDTTIDRGNLKRSLTAALIASLGFGGFFILIDQAESTSVLWKLTAARGGSAIFLLVLVTTLKRRWLPDRSVMPAVIGVGILDLLGNAFFIMAEQQGRLDIAVVLSSLYPAVTILLARIILKERLSNLQFVGVLAALVAIVFIVL